MNKPILLYLAASMALVACSNQPPQPPQSGADKVAATLEEMELQQSNRAVRIRDYRVNSWRYIDQYNLIIKAGLKDNYLISLHTPCPELSGAIQIGFTSTAGTLDKFEDIIVSGPLGRREICAISDIVKLEGIPKGEPKPESE